MCDLQTALIGAGYRPIIRGSLNTRLQRAESREIDECRRNVVRCGTSKKLRYAIAR